MAFSLLTFFALAVVSAAIVMGWNGTQIYLGIEDTFTSEEVLCELMVTAGDGVYELCPFDATNNLDRPLDVDFELKVQKEDTYGEYVNLADDAGVYVGLSEDLQYAYDSEYGDCSDWACAEDWMIANPDWFDWYLTQDYVGYYDTSIITNHIDDPTKPEEDSITVIDLTTGVLPISEEVPANYEIHSVIYVGSGLNLEAGNYRVVFNVVNVAETA